MRWLPALILAAAAAGCAGAHGDDPAWPKLHASETDGGESLAPRPTTQVAAAVARSEDKTPAAIEAPVVAAAPAAGSAAVVAPTITAPDDVITTEDMVIEVDE